MRTGMICFVFAALVASGAAAGPGISDLGPDAAFLRIVGDGTLARDAFYAKGIVIDHGADEGAVERRLGLRTSFIVRSIRPDGLCEFAEVSEREIFRSGDRFRMRIQPNADGYLYVILHGAEGEVEILFPFADEGETAHRLKAFERHTIPRRAWFRFDEQTGIERVYLIFSEERVESLEDAAFSDEVQLSASTLVGLVAGYVGKPGAVSYEKEATSGGNTDAGYYIQEVNEGEVLVRRFDLVHRKKGH